MSNSFGTQDRLAVDDVEYLIHRLDRIKTARRLPYSLKVLLENLLRNEDGHRVTAEQVQALAQFLCVTLRRGLKKRAVLPVEVIVTQADAHAVLIGKAVPMRRAARQTF